MHGNPSAVITLLLIDLSVYSAHHTAGKLEHLQIRSSCKQLLLKLNSQIHVSVCTHSYTDIHKYTIKHLHLSAAHILLTLTSL